MSRCSASTGDDAFDRSRSLFQELPTDVDEEIGEQGLLAREVTVDGRAADAGLGGEVLHGHGAKTSLGEESRRGANEL